MDLRNRVYGQIGSVGKLIKEIDGMSLPVMTVGRLMKRWDPVHGSKNGDEIPPNFSPGVMPVLNQILVRSISKGITRSAVLSKDAVHIKSSFSFDIGKQHSPFCRAKD